MLDKIAVFNKLPMHFESKNLTTFSTSFGVLKYHILPFGFTISLAIYQHYMNNTPFSYFNNFCQVYLDYLLIETKTKKEHWENLRKLPIWLHKVCLYVNIDKCDFHIHETLFSRILMEKLQIDINKIQAIVN